MKFKKSFKLSCLCISSLNFAPGDSPVSSVGGSPVSVCPSYVRGIVEENHTLERQNEYLERELETQKESAKKDKEYIEHLEQNLQEHRAYMDFLQKHTHDRLVQNDLDWGNFLNSPLNAAVMLFAALLGPFDQVNPNNFKEPC